MQNAVLRTATGYTQDTNIQHLHDETLILPIHEHLQLYASQYKQQTQHPSHPLHKHTTNFNIPRLKTPTIFNNGRYTTNIPTDPRTITATDIKTNMGHIHTSIVSRHLVTSFKIQYAFIHQEHNIIYSHMNENNIRPETSTKEQKNIIDATLIFMSVDFRHTEYVNFRGIRARLNLGKYKVFNTNKE